MAIALTKNNFDNVIDGSKKPVLVDFWASWCGPCRMQSPILDELEKKESENIAVCKLNTDDERDIAHRYKIQSIPTLILFRNGEEVRRVSGVQTIEKLISFIKD